MQYKKDMERLHRSVMVTEVIDNLKISKGGVYADLTFGEGGHTEAMLEAGAGKVIGVDRDAETLKRYTQAGKLKDAANLSLIHARFSEFASDPMADGIQGALMDLGVSTRQLLEPERGFSLASSGPLDMRMDRNSGRTLAEALERASQEDLSSALETYGELNQSKRLASELITRFHKGQLKTTWDLKDLMPGKNSKGKSNATVLFMALRMWVNQELKEIETAIPQLIDRMAVGGRLVVLTFHSVEDRIVKKLFKSLSGHCACGETVCVCPRVERVNLVTRKALLPSRSEVRQNPRARSVKLRCVEKVSPSV